MPNAPRTFRSGGNQPRRKKAKRWDPRKPAHKRGYDWDWHKLRNQYIQLNPLCEHCDKKGKLTEANEVDHIIPFNGPDDPLRLDANNLQSLCRACHKRKTDREEKTVGKLFIICGPPASGKTTYVEQHKKPNDIVFDYDKVAHAMGYEMHDHTEDIIEPIEALRQATLNKEAAQDRWVIYVNLIRARTAAQQHNGNLTILDTPRDVCIQRLTDLNRPRLKQRIERVNAWWDAYEATN